MPLEIDKKKYFDVNEIAALYKVHYRTIRRWMTANKIKGMIIGQKVYILESDYLKFIKKEK